MERLLRNGHALYVEAGPGKALAGLMRDINRDAKVFSGMQDDDLSKLRLMAA
jgi:hypothetical protein